MAEKRKLLAEIDKCFKKIDEGVELFEETMAKMHEANSDNQRDKFQDDLKKEIKKLQRLRDQVKNWQNSSDIKDKEKLTQYRKIIEARMEQFKDVERENKTKPHSKQGLCAEEKMDPKDRERYETIEWIQNILRALNDESDKIESQIESLSSAGETTRRRGKQKEDPKKCEKEKSLNQRLERIKLHIDQLEICMRLINNETLEPAKMDKLKEDLEALVDSLEGDDILEIEDVYDELRLSMLAGQLGVHSGSVDEDRHENGVEQGNGNHGSPLEDHTKRNSPLPPLSGSVEVPPSPPALVKRVSSLASSTASIPPSTPLKLNNQSSVDSPSLSSPPPPTPPPPPGIPYNSVAAGIRAASTQLNNKDASPSPIVAPPPPAASANDENRAPSTTKDSSSLASTQAIQLPPEKKSEDMLRVGSVGAETECISLMGDSLREQLRLSTLRDSSDRHIGPKSAMIPPCLGASPLGRAPPTADYAATLEALEMALHRLPLQMDSERPRSYLPKMPCATPAFYPQQPPSNADSMEYYLRLSPETLFFTFYYMEGSRAQLLAAKALKKLSWRFHTKYLMWFQRHEEPKQITDDFEEGTYVYFDFEKWSQRKKEQFRFEYKYLEDKDFE